MSVLIDTSVWFAKVHERDDSHDLAQSFFSACLEGEHGPVYTTTDVVDEALTLALARGKSEAYGMVRDLAGFFGLRSYPPSVASVLDVDHSVQEEAWGLLKRHCDGKALSFTDCTSLVLARDYRVDAIASLDDDFEGLFPRVPND